MTRPWTTTWPWTTTSPSTTSPSTSGGRGRHPPAGPVGRRGFSFTEVMFAVMILGIGFIMIAAVFPVAIRLNQQSVEETGASVLAQRAVQMLAAFPTETVFPPTSQGITEADRLFPQLVTVGESREGLPAGTANNPYRLPVDFQARRTWDAVRGELVSQVDRRVGFAVAYGRSASSGVIRATVVMGRARGDRQAFNDLDAVTEAGSGRTHLEVERGWARDIKIPHPSDFNDRGDLAVLAHGNTAATLQLKRLEARFWASTTGAPDRVMLMSALTGGDVSVAGEGAFLIIANVNRFNPDSPTKARLHGRVVRLGRQVGGDPPSASFPTGRPIFELVPGQDVQALLPTLVVRPSIDEPGEFLSDSTFSTNSVEVLVLGRSLLHPNRPWHVRDNPYVGPVLDVAVYSTVIGARK